jgi:hypothetical protein
MILVTYARSTQYHTRLGDTAPSDFEMSLVRLLYILSHHPDFGSEAKAMLETTR